MKVKGQLWMLAVLAALAPLATGCGGLNASHSVSPATFLLPGILMNSPTDSPALEPFDPARSSTQTLAQAN